MSLEQEGALLAEKGIRPPLCEVNHVEEFGNDFSDTTRDSQLRESIRHVITVRHRVNGNEYGGYEPGPELVERFNLSWFQKAGLLKPVVLRFKGSVEEVVKFAWPEGFVKEQEKIQEKQEGPPKKIRRNRSPRLIGTPKQHTESKIARLPIRWDEEIFIPGFRQLKETFDSPEYDTVAIFLKEIGKYPLFSAAQERIALKYFADGKSLQDLKDDPEFLSSVKFGVQNEFDNAFRDSKTIRDLIVNCNLRLIVSIAKKFKGRGLPLLDLIQEGVPGLLRAIEKFDVERGFKLSTYATWWIKQSIIRSLQDTSTIIRVPVHVQEQIHRARKPIEDFYKDNERNPTARELKELLLSQTDLSEFDVNNLIQTLQSNVTQVDSLDAEIDEGEGNTLYDSLPDKDSNQPDSFPISDSVALALSNLPERERKIIELRFGFDPGRTTRTLEEVSRYFEVTRERVRQLEAKALKKLRTDPNLAWWEKDPPSSFYRTSAENAALRIGAGNITRDDIRQEPAKKTNGDSAQILEPIQIIQKAAAIPQVWDSLGQRERSILKLYARGADIDISEERISKIFGLSVAEVKKVIKDTIIQIESVLASRA